MLSGLAGQDCPIINHNGSFEETIFVLGGEPTIGITTGQIQNWSSSHGTVDYLTTDWNWYDLEGISSNTGHLCYGNRDSHDHSEGMFTSAKIYGDDDLIYTISMDYSTICDAAKNGFLNIALNNNLNSDGHNHFTYPTPEAFPEFFQEIQVLDRFELLPESNFEQNGMSNYEVSFEAHDDFGQIWFFTEYQYPNEDFVNCGLIMDEVKLTATTSSLIGIDSKLLESNNYLLSPKFSKALNVVSYDWSLAGQTIGNGKELIYTFDNGIYNLCLDIVDERGACGSTCQQIIISDIEETEELGNACTYSLCLDMGGIPYVVSFDYLNSEGQLESLDETTDGFFFPYCMGSPNMCEDGNWELNDFIEDLNNFFDVQNLDFKASLAYSAIVPNSDCRSLPITISTSKIEPIALGFDDFSEDEMIETKYEFDFDASLCAHNSENYSASIPNFDESLFSHEKNTYEDKVKSIVPTILRNEVIIYEDDILNSISNIVLFTSSGQKMKSINNYNPGDEINIHDLPIGVYVIMISNKQFKKSSFFFKGE